MAKFIAGKSGNSKGRPKGIKDRRHLLRDQLKARAPELVDKVIEQALQGDTAALKLCLDRLMPPLRPASEPVQFRAEGNTLTDQTRAIVNAMANGALPPDQAATMITALSAMARVLEADEFDRRLEELESRDEIA